MQAPRRRSGLSRDLAGWTALLTLVSVSALIRAWVGTKVAGPWFIPDEVTYAQLGESLYRTGHFEILGHTPNFFGLVYPLFVGLPLHAAGVARGYSIAKGLQALVMSLAAIPIYAWGRSLATAEWALAAAALTLAAPVLGLTGFLMTETLFYPAFCLAAWLIARALVTPTLGRQSLALAAILLAALTRLQAVALVPAFVLAVLLEVVFSRTWGRGLRRFVPSLATLVVAVLAWFAIAAARGGRVLGVYAVTADVRYDAFEAVRFVAYHGADVILATAVVPVVAFCALAVPSVRGLERAPEVRALVATVIGLTLAFLPIVGVYASVFTERIAERNLSFLAPVFFLAFAVWLGRGAPRPLAVVVFASAAAFLLLLATPWSRFVVPAAEPDAFTLVPFVELRERFSGFDPGVAVLAVGAGLLALLALPRRLLALSPLLLVLLLGVAAGWSAHVATSSAILYERGIAGTDARWVDRAAPGPVVFLYSGEYGWTEGGPVWVNAFWNRRIQSAISLFGSKIAGDPSSDRRPVDRDGRIGGGRSNPTSVYAVASTRLQLAGAAIASSSAGFVLWRIEPPLRILTRKDGVDAATGLLGRKARLVAYACRGGSLALTLVSPDDRVVRVARGGVFYRSARLVAGRPWTAVVPVEAPRPAGSAPCEVSVAGTAGVRAERFDFSRP